MKTNKYIFYLLLLALSFVNSSFITNSQKQSGKDGSDVFTLVYLDNSRPGPSAKMLEFLYITMESVQKNFLFYLSNGTTPFFSKDNAEVINKFETLNTDGYTLFPDFVRDKNIILQEMRTVKMNNYKTIRLYFFVTENYLEELLQYNPAYFIKIFPTELLTLTGNEFADAEVNIYYTPNQDSKAETILKNIDSRFNFYNSGKYSKNIKYNLIAK